MVRLVGKTMTDDKKADDPFEAMEDDLTFRRFEQVVTAANAYISRNSGKMQAWTLRGKALERMGDHDAAVRNFQSAARQAPKAAKPRYELGMLQIRAGQFHKAERALREALALDPDYVWAYQGLLNVAPIGPEDPATRRLQAMADDEKVSLSTRVQAYFLAGRILIQAGRHEPGFRLFETGNRLHFEAADPKRREYKMTDRNFRVEPGYYRAMRRSEPATPALPAVFVVGLPRAGKSLIENLLATQPTVMEGGELPSLGRYFTGWKRKTPMEEIGAEIRARTHSALGETYQALCATARGKTEITHVVDTMPGNIARLGYLSQLHPDVPVVLSSRDRFDLGLSIFFKDFKSGHFYSNDLGALGRALARVEFMTEYWLRELPNPVIRVRYEDLVDDPFGVTSAVIGKMGLAVDEPALRAKTAPPAHSATLFVSRSDSYATIDKSGTGAAKPFMAWLTPMEEAYQAEREELAGRLV